jgi:hypothetical protein
VVQHVCTLPYPTGTVTVTGNRAESESVAQGHGVLRASGSDSAKSDYTMSISPPGLGIAHWGHALRTPA